MDTKKTTMKIMPVASVVATAIMTLALMIYWRSELDLVIFAVLLVPLFITMGAAGAYYYMAKISDDKNGDGENT